MVQRDLRLNLSAETTGLERGLKRGERALESYQRKIEDANTAMMQLEMELQRDIDRTLAEVEAQAERRAEIWNGVGRGMLVTGAAITAGLALASRAAIQWESDWAGVTKTIEASPEQMEALERSLRDLALQIPVTHTELAGIAASAGQLGVESQNIVGFTRTIAAMGVTTNLTVEEAATQMARFGNIMGTPQEEVDRLGAAVVELGNNSATTEAEILEMGMRIAGAGRTVGLTEGEVLGFAAALSSIGMEAEAGGSAVSRVLLNIDTAVMSSGEQLQQFADVAGVSASEYADAWANDPAAATATFVAGLGRMNESGENVTATLDRLGLGEIVVRDALLRMAGASDLVASSLELGNEGWEENLALVEEAATRYDTTQSQMQIAQNSINEMGISLGENLLPIVGSVAERINDWGAAYSSLSEDQQGVVAGVGGTTGALALLTGALITVGPRLIEFRSNMDELRTNGASRLQRGLGGLASFVTGPYGAALAGAMVLGGLWLDQKAQQIAHEQDWASVLAESEGAVTSSTAAHAAKRLEDEGLLEIATELGLEEGRLTEAVLRSGEARDALTLLQQHSKDVQDGLITGNSDETATTEELNEALQVLFGSGVDISTLRGEELDQIAALANGTSGLSEEMTAGAEAQAALALETGNSADQFQTAAEAADAFRDSMDRVNSVIADGIEAELNYNDTLLRATETIEENRGATDRNTEAGIGNHRAILSVIAAGEREIETMIDNGATTEELEAKKRELRRDVEDLGEEVGYTETEFRDYDRMLDNVDSEVDTAIEVRANGTWSSTGGDGPNFFFAEGGAVYGEGGPTEDKVPAWLSSGEHVLTAREVALLGGQDKVYAMRDLIRSGALRFAKGGAVEPQRFARGGAVLPPSARIVEDHTEQTRINLQRLYADTVTGVATDMAEQFKEAMASGGSVVQATTRWAGTPYSWGGGTIHGPGLGFGRGAGIRGFDCSSLMQHGWYQGTGGRVHLPRVTYDQINVGRSVPRGGERPGDLVFPHRGHVAMVVGPGRLFHTFRTGDVAGYRSMYPAPLAIRRPTFDRGGIWQSGMTGENASGHPERVLSPEQTQVFERLVDGLLSRTGALSAAPGSKQSVTYVVNHVPGYTTEQDLRRVRDREERRERVGRPM